MSEFSPANAAINEVLRVVNEKPEVHQPHSVVLSVGTAKRLLADLRVNITGQEVGERLAELGVVKPDVLMAARARYQESLLTDVYFRLNGLPIVDDFVTVDLSYGDVEALILERVDRMRRTYKRFGETRGEQTLEGVRSRVPAYKELTRSIGQASGLQIESLDLELDTVLEEIQIEEAKKSSNNGNGLDMEGSVG